MINKFMTVYAGHIDVPDHGQNATPANDRRYSNDELASVFDSYTWPETLATMQSIAPECEPQRVAGGCWVCLGAWKAGSWHRPA
jgi:hypothetical protein